MLFSSFVSLTTSVMSLLLTLTTSQKFCSVSELLTMVLSSSAWFSVFFLGSVKSLFDLSGVETFGVFSFGSFSWVDDSRLCSGEES